MEKLHSYQGWGGRMHEWRDQIRERYANWREQHPETVIELIKKGARPSPSSDAYSHIYRSQFEFIFMDFLFKSMALAMAATLSERSDLKGEQINLNYSNRLQCSMANFIAWKSCLIVVSPRLKDQDSHGTGESVSGRDGHRVFVRCRNCVRVADTVEHWRATSTHDSGVGTVAAGWILSHANSGLAERSMSTEYGPTTSVYRFIVDWNIYWWVIHSQTGNALLTFPRCHPLTLPLSS